MGAGQFGSLALRQLSKQQNDRQFVMVDPDKEKLLALKGLNIAIEQADAIQFLNDHLDVKTAVSWIIPSLPVHLAWEWCQIKIGPDRLIQTPLSPEMDSLVPNPMHGPQGNLYVSHADFLCPTNCSEPEDICTVTKRHRKQDMFALLEGLHYKDYASLVLRSRQLAPGVGGYSPGQLFSFLKKVENYKGRLLLCTACRCHGVITGAEI